MACLTYQLLSVTVTLSVVQLTGGYSFNNCIGEQGSTKFSCIHRQTDNLSAIIGDLPHSAINLTVSINPVKNLPNGSFVHLPNLQCLKLDHNILNSIDVLAFQNLFQLTSLNLSFNFISELNPSVFKDLHSLTFLSLANNNLKQLPVTVFSSVLKLDTFLMRENNLANFSVIAESVSHLENLTLLDISLNQLTSLTHSNVSLPNSLATLYIGWNNLSTLGCNQSFLSQIKVLDLSSNSRLPSVAFKGVDLRRIMYLRLCSTSVRPVEFLNVSTVKASRVDFSGMGLENANLVEELCGALKGKVKWMKNLNLSSNGIETLTNHTLYNCPQITGSLVLSRNKLRSLNCLSFLKGQNRTKSFDAEHNLLNSLPSCNENAVLFNTMEELTYRYNRILSVSADAFRQTPNIKTLKLNINTIAFLHHRALRGLKKLETLRLDNNLLTDLFNDTFEDLNNLQILNLRNNRISVIFNVTFHNLSRLTTLDLGGNKITQIDKSGLQGLTSLSKFYLDGNNLRLIHSTNFTVFQDTLTVLDLQRNQIQFLSDQVSSPFMNLSKLTDLKLDGQLPYGLTTLPRAFFRGLHSLRSLYLTNNRFSHLADNAFDDLTALRFLTLDNSFVGVAQLQPGVFKNLNRLTRLVVEDMGIQNFTKEVFGNLTKLRILQLNRNVMQSIDVDALNSLPELNYLDIRNIPLRCTCDNSLLQNWTIHNTNVQVVYLYNLQCPNDKNSSFYNFDTQVCFIDVGEYLFLGTAVVIFLFTLVPLIYVKLYWRIKYSYYVFCSWFGEQWRKLREEEENCKYDAFISYNSSDEPWVMEQLLPNLEGNGSSFKLCLHHRDFEPGRYIVDNIVSAVYSSRKTVCVVSRNFLRSEWCSLEIQLASYRLFDEHRDVLLLVFLEPISERQLSSYHRMRKDMLKKTYLQWPGSDCTDPTQARDLFWNQLRRALKQGSGGDEEIVDDSETDKETTEHEDKSSSDANYYLLP
ncbi:toll-like receptor 21 [Genypterus blacodes]|uniref:toll-like receptor 21 n=1 Tax=Genypterus blacodes TaxID=154954 RepID=UPI003F76360A